KNKEVINMMSKISKYIGTLMLLFFAVPMAVFADNHNGQDSDIVQDVINEREIKIFNYPKGAEVRLVQLQDRIDAQIYKANLIVENIETENVNIENLEDIINRFKDLKLSIVGLNMEQSTEVLTREFVEIKLTAIELSREFRIELENISEFEREEVRNILNESEYDNEELEGKVEMLQNEFKTQQVEKILSKWGIEDKEFVDKVISGELSIGEIRSEMVSKFKDLSVEEKKEILAEMKEEKQKKRIEVREMVESLREEVTANRPEVPNQMNPRN
ncbi:MAG: hypothetical protein ACOC2U_04920, partial [bacterium]